MARSWHWRFGTYKVIVDNQILYFQSMADIKQWFKQMVKDLCMELAKNALKVLLNYIPTESGQLAASIYSASRYGVMDWRDQIICKFQVIDPKFYVFVSTEGKSKSKKIRNPSHSHSKHRSSRAPDTTLNNPNVHLLYQNGNSFIYNRDDPLATTNYLAVMRRFLKDMVATAISRIMRKTYYIHYFIKVSKNQYGKDSYLNPSAIGSKTGGFKVLKYGVDSLSATPTPKYRSMSVETMQKQSASNPQLLDEFGTFLQLYNTP
jgi:hypothetical protein